MKLHRNAALSWQGRRRLARRVVAEGWTLTAAAEAAGVSVRCARKWVGPLPGRGRARVCSIVRRRPGGSRTAPLPIGSRRSWRCARLRMTAAEIAETLGMALSTVSAILTQVGDGPSRPDRARAADPLRALAAWRARPHRRQEARPYRGWRRQASLRSTATRPTTRSALTPRARVRNTVGWEYVHIAVDDYSRLAYAEVLPDEKAVDRRSRFLRRARRLLPPPRHPVERHPHRQRLLLPRHHPRARLPHPRHPPQPHPSLPTTNKRQSRTLHPHPARRLGLRRHLPLKPANAPTPLTAGSGTTTIDADTQPSATNPRPAEPTCLGPTPRRAVAVRL